ncbi:hypothetical protein [Coxiella-like endosymbiont]|nr:hypothetical protein [Coxiella-like endosymbiont]
MHSCPKRLYCHHCGISKKFLLTAHSASIVS